MSMVYVVTMPELGWDCVVGVFNSDFVTIESLEKAFPEGQFVIHERSVEKDVYDYE